MEGNPDALEREIAGARPPDDALELERLARRLATGLFGAAEDPARIGRHAILGRLGQGGMGVVYAAFDPVLDRKVAIKLLHPDREVGSERLLREARAVALLSHPNVVQIFDVGLDRGRVYMAMELVEGVPLDVWLGERPRRLAEVLRVLVQAGRGLQAAHEAGLVHRDFKPANVLVGRDGRARVLDLGLAHAPSERDPDDPTAGTAAYMAPEQHEGGPVDPRSDVYAFCVALHEAACGARPFAGATAAELSSAKRAGARGRAREHGRRVPRWLARVIDRGLDPDPERRFSDMGALLGALERPNRRRGRIAIGVAAVGLVAAVIVRSQVAGSDLCTGGPARTDAVWTAATRTAVHDAFARSSRPHAQLAAATAIGRLDAWAEAWQRSHRDACEATRVRGEQGEAVLDRRMACLDDRLDELRATAAVLAAADDDVVDRAVAVVHGIAPVEDCEPAARLDARGTTAPVPVRARVLERSRESLADARALMLAGRYHTAWALAHPIATAAAELEHPGLLPRALHLQGALDIRLGRPEPAEAALQAAWVAARRGGDVETEARILVTLVFLVGNAQARTAEGERLGAIARALVDELGAPVQLSAALEGSLGDVASRAGDHRTSRARFERMLELLPEGDPEVAYAHQRIADAFGVEGDLEASERHQRRALELRIADLGPDHPLVGWAHNNLGIALLRRARFAEAETVLARALAVREASLGPRHPEVAGTLVNLGALAYLRGDDETALATMERALDIARATWGPDHHKTAQYEQNVGSALVRLGRLDEAGPLLADTIERMVARFGPDHPDVAGAKLAVAELELARGRADEAIELAREAVALHERARVHGPAMLSALVILAKAEREKGESVAALSTGSRALAMAARVGSPVDVARVQLELAQTLGAITPESAGAKALARAALATYREAGMHPSQIARATAIAG